MPRANPNDTKTVTSEDITGWLPGSSMTLRTHQTSADRLAINQLSADVDVELPEDVAPVARNRAERRDKRFAQQAARPKVHTTMRYERYIAALAVMEVNHQGPEFSEGGEGTPAIPFHDDPELRARELASLDNPDALSEVHDIMTEFWGGRSTAEQDRFRQDAAAPNGRPAPGVGAQFGAGQPGVGEAPAGLASS